MWIKPSLIRQFHLLQSCIAIWILIWSASIILMLHLVLSWRHWHLHAQVKLREWQFTWVITLWRLEIQTAQAQALCYQRKMKCSCTHSVHSQVRLVHTSGLQHTGMMFHARIHVTAPVTFNWLHPRTMDHRLQALRLLPPLHTV